jgi:hypothetical protein
MYYFIFYYGCRDARSRVSASFIAVVAETCDRMSLRQRKKKPALLRTGFWKIRNDFLVGNNNQVFASAPEISVIQDNKFVN